MQTVSTALFLVALGVIATPALAVPTLRAVRAINTPDMTRLIIELSEPAEHRIQRQARDPVLGVPERVVIEFGSASLARDAKVPNTFPEGPAVRLRAVASGPQSVRLLVDVPGLSDVGTFFLPDPYRLIVDLRGTARAGRVRPTPTPTAVLPVLVVPRTPAPELRAAAPKSAKRRFKIVIDPGHGGKDPGASGVTGVAEKDVVLSIARRLRDRLRADPSVDVVLTRDSDIFLRLEERTARANAEQADLFLSIHANASTNPAAAGVETYYLNNTDDRATLRLAAMENGLKTMTRQTDRDPEVALILSDLIQNYKIEESVALARQVQKAVVQSLVAQGAAVTDLGVKRGPFYVLVGAGMPGVLAEVSFLTNPQEGARLADPVYQDAIADGLLRGLKGAIENTAATGAL